MLQVSIPIRKNKECLTAGNYTLSSKQLCAGDGINFDKSSTSHDSCQGDSGGPLIIKENDFFYQVGIVSYGTSKCDGVGVYTNVASYLDWISLNMQEKKP